MAHATREYRDDIESIRMIDIESGGDVEHQDQLIMHMSSTTSTSPTKYDSSFYIFNDLTYSDDDELDDLQSSPSDSPPQFQFQGIPQQKQRKLMHPLARSNSDSYQQTDDESCLQYSISTTLLDDQSRASSCYGSVNAVVFRASTPVFDSPERPQERSPQREHQPLLPPPLRRQFENSHPNRSSQGNYKTTTHVQPSVSPFPSSDESPQTSVTDATQSSSSNIEEMRRSVVLEDKKRRRERRLKRIRKAAEARDATVQKVRGVQQDSCNDSLFAFLFLCQFLLVSMAAMAFGPAAIHDRLTGAIADQEGMEHDYNPFAGLQSDDIIVTGLYEQPKIDGGDVGGDLAGHGDERISYIDYVNVIQLICVASGYASFSSIFALGFMMMLSRNLLQAILIFTVVVCLSWSVLGLALSNNFFIPAIGILALAISACYTWVVWDRIPFAATNLSVALKGMRGTLDIPLLGVCNLVATFAWTICWICAFFGASDYLWNEEELSNDWMVVVVIFFFFSYYWTTQVIKGVSQATVAGIIGHWWNITDEEHLPLCSGAFYSALLRTLSKGFGSICLGSLVLGPSLLMSRLWTFPRLAKPKIARLRNPELSLPSHEFDENAFNNDVIARHINQWSYSYIGLYGYSFWDAGFKASELFQARGWTHVVSDHLILSSMSMSTVVIGVSTACLGVIVSEVDGYSFSAAHKPLTSAFLISLLVGYYLSSAFLSIIQGSVSAILVCYAVAPVDLHANHPLLSKEMKTGWKQFWIQKK